MAADTTAVGVDWGSNGWVVAVRDADGWDARLHPSLLSVWHAHHDADSVLIDIPIGLPARGRRACDERARDVLGAQGRRVFLAPPCAAPDAPTYTNAKRCVEARADGSLTTQAWNGLPQVRDADVLLDAMCPVLTAWTDRGTLATLPADPERGVAMEIVYREV